MQAASPSQGFWRQTSDGAASEDHVHLQQGALRLQLVARLHAETDSMDREGYTTPQRDRCRDTFSLLAVVQQISEHFSQSQVESVKSDPGGMSHLHGADGMRGSGEVRARVLCLHAQAL